MLDGQHRVQTHAQCYYVYIWGGGCISTKVMLKKVKVKSQKVNKNKSLNHAVRHMFSGSFPRRSIRSRLRLNFQIDIFCIITTCPWLSVSSEFQIWLLFSCTMYKTPKILQFKKSSHLIVIYCYKRPRMEISYWNFVCVNSVCVLYTNTVVYFYV